MLLCFKNILTMLVYSKNVVVVLDIIFLSILYEFVIKVVFKYQTEKR